MLSSAPPCTHLRNSCRVIRLVSCNERERERGRSISKKSSSLGRGGEGRVPSLSLASILSAAEKNDALATILVNINFLRKSQKENETR